MQSRLVELTERQWRDFGYLLDAVADSRHDQEDVHSFCRGCGSMCAELGRDQHDGWLPGHGVHAEDCVVQALREQLKKA